MKKRQFEALCKMLLPDLPGFTCKGWLLYAVPLGHVLRGFCCDDSGFDPKKFTVWAFFLPLYVPRQYLSFNMGFRLKDVRGCDRWWKIDDPRLGEELLACIQQQGLPFLEAVKQPCDVVTAIQRLGIDSNVYNLEAMAYSLVMIDDVVAAQQALERLTKLLDTSVPWQAEMKTRAMELARKLDIDPQEARRQLAEWEQATVKNLGLG